MPKEYITGKNPVYETITANRRQIYRLFVAAGAHEKGKLSEIIQLAEARKIPISPVNRPQLDHWGENHQGVAAEVNGYSYCDTEDILEYARSRQEPLFILILDLIQNPQNLGTLLRTAEAAGIHGVILPLARSAIITPAVVTASAGASEHILIAQSNLSQAITRIKEVGGWVVGLEGSPSAKLPNEVRLDGPLAIIVGNEGEGMRPLVRNSCDFHLRLPMFGKVESLNASVAGSIALYLAVDARHKKDQST